VLPAPFGTAQEIIAAPLETSMQRLKSTSPEKILLRITAGRMA
jgi:hypothetical protein